MRRRAHRLLLLAVALLPGCDGAEDCAGEDPLRCRVERSEDPAVREALAPFLVGRPADPPPDPGS